MILNCYVDEDTLRDLQLAAHQTGRKVEELAEAAIQNAAIEFRLSQPPQVRTLQTLTREEHETKHRRSPGTIR